MGRFLTNTQVSAACDSSPPLCREEIAECKCPKGIHSSVKQVRDKKCIGGERWLGSTGGKKESSVGRSVGRSAAEGEGWMPSAVTFPPPSPKIKFQCAHLFRAPRRKRRKISRASFLAAQSASARGTDGESAFSNAGPRPRAFLIHVYVDI